MVVFRFFLDKPPGAIRCYQVLPFNHISLCLILTPYLCHFGANSPAVICYDSGLGGTFDAFKTIAASPVTVATLQSPLRLAL